MSAGADWTPPPCLRCGGAATQMNRLIGGRYCAPCDDFITKPDPKLEEKYNRRVAARKAEEVTA